MDKSGSTTSGFDFDEISPDAVIGSVHLRKKITVNQFRGREFLGYSSGMFARIAVALR
jgi:hypothetical protein